MLPLERVHIDGWDARTITRAIGALSVSAMQIDEAGAELAIELLRWLRCATQSNMRRLLSVLETIRPEGLDASAWDHVITNGILTRYDTDRLCRESPNAVLVLCELLDRVAQRECRWEQLDHAYQRYVLALLIIGTPAALRYLLSKPDLLYAYDKSELTEPVRSRESDLLEAAHDLWPSQTWEARSQATATLDDHGLDVTSLVALTMAVPPDTLTIPERICYVRILSCARSQPARDLIAQVFRMAMRTDGQTPEHRTLLQESYLRMRHRDLTEAERQFARLHDLRSH